MIMICSVDCQFFISVLKKLHPRATCHQSLQNNCCIGSFSCCFGAKVCAYGKCSLICVSAETHSISWILATLEIAPLLCVSSCCRRSFFPSAASEEFNGSVGGHVRFIDAVVSWNTQNEPEMLLLCLYSLQTTVSSRSLFRAMH